MSIEGIAIECIVKYTEQVLTLYIQQTYPVHPSSKLSVRIPA